MNYRKFGKTDLLVSEIGFGGWAIGGGAMVGSTAIGWGNANDAISKEAILKSIALGVNFFDTADIYGLGHSEELLGKIVGNHKDVIIATKVGNVSRNDQFTYDYSKKYILGACDASLKRLKREYVDYYQLHTARLSDLQKGDCIEAMQILQQSGKVRYWGLSLNTYEPFPEADYMLDNHAGSGFQLAFNMINQTALPLIKKAFSLGYGVIARMPLQFGLLTGKFDNGAKFPDNDHRKTRLTKEIIEAYKLNMERIWVLCEKYNVTRVQLALSYILSYPEISTVIPGIRTVEQAENNLSGIIQMEKEDIALIENTNFSITMAVIRQQG